MTSPLPPNESGRLEALRRYKILDTASEQTFDEIAALAAHISGDYHKFGRQLHCRLRPQCNCGRTLICG